MPFSWLENYRFSLRPGLSAVTFGCLVILLALGNWQLERRAWKEALIARVEARQASAPLPFPEVRARHIARIDQSYQPVVVHGRYDHTREAHLSGIHQGVPGWFVFTPLELARIPENCHRFLDSNARQTRTLDPIHRSVLCESGPEPGLERDQRELEPGLVEAAAFPEGASLPAIVYVNRGFVPDDRKARATRPEVAVDDDFVTVTGLFRPATTRPVIAAFFKPPDNPDNNEWYDRTPELWAAHAGITAEEGFTIDSFDSGAAFGPHGGTTRLSFRNRHYEYALTWFGLAGALVAVYVAFCLQSRETAD